MKKSTQDIDLHARGTACLNELTKSDEKVNGLKDIIEVLFGNDPNALLAMPIFVIRTYCSSEKSGPRSARLRLRVRRVEERLEVHRGWQRRPGAVEHRRGGGQNRLVVSRLVAAKTECSRRKQQWRARFSREDCERSGAASITDSASSDVGARQGRRRGGYFSYEQVAGPACIP